jgi:hypothetical protein
VSHVQQLVQHVLTGQHARVVDRRAVRIEDHPDQGGAGAAAFIGHLEVADPLGADDLPDLEVLAYIGNHGQQTVT